MLVKFERISLRSSYGDLPVYREPFTLPHTFADILTEARPNYRVITFPLSLAIMKSSVSISW